MIKTISIKYKILIILSLLTAISIFILVDFFNYIDSWRESDHISDEGRSITRMLSAVVTSGIKTGNLFELEKNIKYIIENSKIFPVS